MKICIVGTGASGWIVCHYLEKLPFVSEITIIGSPSIPTIGVGESTTYSFRNFLNHLFNDPSEYWKFLKDADAAFKYGVKYQGWSEKDFLHAFVGGKDNNLYGYLLGKKSKDVSADSLSMPLFEEIYNNLICTDSNVQNYSFHFDANKLIAAFENLAKKKSKIKHLKNTVVESIQENGQIKKIKLDDGEVIDADYFISCIGQTAFNQKVFFEEYDSLTDILLTDKAIFYPLEYKNKKQEMHPYTIAKPMKYGWRWITPTWSRIGTGYVFSSKHVSVDDAINEFINDIGDTSIKPFVTDFIPRKSKNPYKINSCTLGMASGFLEPLDAPGLNILISFLPCLEKLLLILKNNLCVPNKEYMCYLELLNLDYGQNLNWWASFILHQYKTCNRNDSQFWIDQKNIKWDHYDRLIKTLFDPLILNKELLFKDRNVHVVESYMIYNTTAGKDITWDVKLDDTPVPPPRPKNITLENHFEFLNKVHNNF